MRPAPLALLWLVAASPAAAEELVLWHSYRAGEAEALAASVDAFAAAHPEHTVRVLAVPAGTFAQKLRSAIPAGHGPDVFIAPHDELGDLVERALVERLPDDVSLTRFLPQTVATVRQREALWGWPMAYKSLALYHRTDLVPAPPEDTDTLIRMAKGLTGDGRFGLAYELGEPYFHAPWLFGHGGRVLDEEGTRALLDSPEAVAAGRFLEVLARDEGVVPVDVNGALVTELFNTGRAAMVLSGPWFLSEIGPRVPYAIAPLPRVSATGQPARPFLTVEALFVARGKLRDSVRTLAEALSSDEHAFLRATKGRQLVANAAPYERPEVAGDAVLMAFRRQLESSVPMPTAPLMRLVWEPFAEALRQIVRGAMPPERAFAEAQQRIAILSRGLPPPATPWPYVTFLCVGLLASSGWAMVRWRRQKLGREVVRARAAYGFIAPAVVGMLLMVGVPFAMGVGTSLFEVGPSEVRFVGFANYVDILAARDYPVTHPLSFYYTLAVTVLWTVSNVTLHVLLGLALALALQPTWLRGRGLFRVLLILPWAVPSYITALVFKGLFNRQLGAINALLSSLGLSPVGWFDSFLPAFSANLVTNVWLGFPFMMVTVLGALQAIPQDLYEAARVDGAGAWRRFTSITAPLLVPALVPAVVLGTIWTFNMFNVVFLVSEGQPEGATDILITEAYRWAFMRDGRYGYAAAYSVVIFGILLLYGAWTRRLLARLRAGT